RRRGGGGGRALRPGFVGGAAWVGAGRCVGERIGVRGGKGGRRWCGGRSNGRAGGGSRLLLDPSWLRQGGSWGARLRPSGRAADDQGEHEAHPSSGGHASLVGTGVGRTALGSMSCDPAATVPVAAPVPTVAPTP